MGTIGTSTTSGSLIRDDFELRYLIQGHGRSVLVMGSAVYYPRTFSEALREKLALVFVDHRGFALAPDFVEPSSCELDTILDDFEAIRLQLSLGTVVALGHSGHAYMALEYAKRYPEHVSHVVMVGAAPDLSPVSMAWAEREWQESADPDRKAAFEENMKRWPDECLAPLSPAEAFVRVYVRNGPRAWFDAKFDATELWKDVTPNEVLFRVWGETFARIDIREGLASLTTPVLVMLGRYDRIVAPPSSWDAYRDSFHDLTIRVFEKSGHTPQIEEAGRFDFELTAWLEEH